MRTEFRRLFRKHFRRGRQVLQASALTAEAENIGSETLQKTYACGGKIAGCGRGKGGRQLKYDIGTAQKGKFRPDILVIDGRLSPLHERGAHDCDNTVCAGLSPGDLYLLFVTRMKGIVFCCNAQYLHSVSSAYSKIL